MQFRLAPACKHKAKMGTLPEMELDGEKRPPPITRPRPGMSPTLASEEVRALGGLQITRPNEAAVLLT